MINRKIGIIGAGNMAEAIIAGVLKSGVIERDNIIVSNTSIARLNYMREKYSVRVTLDNKEVALESDYIILAVKPNKYEEVIKNIKDKTKESIVVITIAAGISIEFIQSTFENKIKTIRTMPNTPALVGEGMTAICTSKEVQSCELEEVLKIFNSFGKTELIEEKLMDIIPAVSGSSPAYVYMFIEAMADAAVLEGMSREKAYQFASQAVLGAAKMVRDSGEHPGVLKDKVCSPGGTTIEAVYTLEMNNFRGTIMSAMKSCTDKTKKISKSN